MRAAPYGYVEVDPAQLRSDAPDLGTIRVPLPAGGAPAAAGQRVVVNGRGGWIMAYDAAEHALHVDFNTGRPLRLWRACAASVGQDRPRSSDTEAHALQVVAVAVREARWRCGDARLTASRACGGYPADRLPDLARALRLRALHFGGRCACGAKGLRVDAAGVIEGHCVGGGAPENARSGALPAGLDDAGEPVHTGGVIYCAVPRGAPVLPCGAFVAGASHSDPVALGVDAAVINEHLSKIGDAEQLYRDLRRARATQRLRLRRAIVGEWRAQRWSLS